MIKIEFDPTTYTHYLYVFYTSNGMIVGYMDSDDNYVPLPEGSAPKPYMELNYQLYDELRDHFLTEHEQPLEAKQAVIDELRDVVRVERTRVDQLIVKALE